VCRIPFAPLSSDAVPGSGNRKGLPDPGTAHPLGNYPASTIYVEVRPGRPAGRPYYTYAYVTVYE
jgi:hypothetical protein